MADHRLPLSVHRPWSTLAVRLVVTLAVAAAGFSMPELAAAAPAAPGPESEDVPVSPIAAKRGSSMEMPAWQPPAAAWPAGGAGVVPVDGSSFGASRASAASAAQSGVAGSGRPGGLPVLVRAATDGDGEPRTAAEQQAQLNRTPPASVRVRVIDRAATEAAAVSGVLFTLERADGQVESGAVALDVDYGGFAGMFGADFGLRLQLVQFPACVLMTPGLPECSRYRPVTGASNVASGRVLSADRVTVAGDRAAAASAKGTTEAVEEPTVLAVTASASSAGGTYSATSLSPTYAWQGGSQGGDFSYSYPIAVPPAVGGAAPELALRYSSGSVDGRTVRQNSQASWVGMGWELSVGYIERQYQSCTDVGTQYRDLCWHSDNASMVFGGVSTKLVKDSAGVWRGSDDRGWKIERLYGAANFSTLGEY
jgi:hypothetical protein